MVTVFIIVYCPLSYPLSSLLNQHYPHPSMSDPKIITTAHTCPYRYDNMQKRYNTIDVMLFCARNLCCYAQKLSSKQRPNYLNLFSTIYSDLKG